MPVDEELSDDDVQASLNIDRPGDVLRRAREKKRMSLEEIAEATRIPIRQLKVIESNDFASLPGTPYALGFARAYARAVGANEAEIAIGVRAELGTVDPAERYEAFAPIDPARVPPRMLAWTAAIIAALLAVSYGVWRAHSFSPPTDSELSASASATPAQNPAAGHAKPHSAAPLNGPVVLTATSDVWLRIYDQTGERLLEKQMAKGESYTVPATANNPMILTGRPDTLAVTVGGRPVAPLGTADKTVADLPISAAALLARPAAPIPNPAAPTSQPAPLPPPAPLPAPNTPNP